MKLQTVFAKLMGSKAMVLRTLGTLAIAGVAMTAAAPAAKAQVSFGVRIGTPRYYAPAPQPVYVAPYGEQAYGYAPGYWERQRIEAERARAWREREIYNHHRDDFRGRAWDGRNWR